MEMLVALLPFGLLALVGLVTWAYRKAGWPTASPRLTEKASQAMDPSYTTRGLPGAHFIGDNPRSGHNRSGGEGDGY
jgi:hypothetical protein